MVRAMVWRLRKRGETATRRPVITATVWVGVAFLAQPGMSFQADQKAGGPAHRRAITADDANRAAILYARHCAACHGDKGDGNGSAARFLEPRPRSLRDGRYRIISSSTAPVASAKDVLEVLNRGMPGSSMPSWNHLPQFDRMLLVGQVLQFRQEGYSDKAEALLKEEGEDVTPEAIREYAAKLAVKEGPPLQVPDFGDPSPESIERGKLLFKKSCASCHGETGKGDGVEKMLTSEGFLQRPRDLTRGIFKGNHDAASIFRRIRLGLPGSAMPSNSQNSDAEIADMTRFILSLSDESTRQSFVTTRRKISAKRVERGFDDPADARWDSLAAESPILFPLWWRDFDDLKLQVRAVHDGESIVLWLKWRDATQDDDVSRTDAFEDMASVQWCKSPDEPFLGMGGGDIPVETWLWRASWHRADQREPKRLLDEYPFDGDNYRELFGEKTRGFPDVFTARSAGNLHADGGRKFSATGLEVKGPGTTTLRPEAAQKVASKSVRTKDGWAATFRRPLAVEAGAGISLAPGDRASVAFAVWDGVMKDRNGQKMVSIWNDLELER